MPVVLLVGRTKVLWFRVLIAEMQLSVAISPRHASVDCHSTSLLNAAAPYSCQIQETQRQPSNNKCLPLSVSVRTIVREDAWSGLSSAGGYQQWLLLLCCTELLAAFQRYLLPVSRVKPQQPISLIYFPSIKSSCAHPAAMSSYFLDVCYSKTLTIHVINHIFIHLKLVQDVPVISVFVPPDPKSKNQVL